MKLYNIYETLDKISPFELQELWDNSGIQVGSKNQEVKKIVLSIDIDEKLIDSLENDTLLITHHPIIFSGLKQINFDIYPTNLLQKMIKKNISNIAMHTNFDKTHLNEFVAKEILGYKIIKQDGFKIYLQIDEDFDIFSQKIKEKLSLDYTKVVKCSNFIKTAVLTTGAGGSLIPEIDADCFLSGDIKYHDAMSAKSINLSLIEIGHFESECFFSEILEKHLKILGLEAIIASSKNPFTYI